MLRKPEIQSLLVHNRNKINELLMDLQHLKAKPAVWYNVVAKDELANIKKERFKTVLKMREKLKRLEFIQRNLKQELRM